MDITTIKKVSTLSGLTISLLIAFAFFTGMYLYWSQNGTDAGYTIEGKYSETYMEINRSRDDLNDNVNAIKNNFDSVAEADNTFEQAWNGLKGVGNTLLLPISFVSTSLATYTGLEFALDFVPRWVRTLVVIGFTALIVFLVLSILKGDPRL